MPWVCEACTFFNENVTATTCEICGSPNTNKLMFQYEEKRERAFPAPAALKKAKSERSDKQSYTQNQKVEFPYEGDEDWGVDDTTGDMEEDLDWGEDDTVVTANREGFEEKGEDLAMLELKTQLTEEGVNILNIEQVDLLMELQVKELSELLGLSEDNSEKLLRECGWQNARVSNAWFADSEKLVAMLDMKQTGIEKEEVDCDICCETVKANDACTLGCGHIGCSQCWGNWISAAYDKGAELIYVKCLGYKCPKLCGEKVIRRFLSGSDRQEKLTDWIRDDYVNSNASLKFCGGKRCSMVIRYVGSEQQGILCKCGHDFCFSCNGPNHDPATCEIAKEWRSKEVADDGNLMWIQGNTKPCPKCNTPIEKNSGCQHMSCKVPSCKHEWCWLCLQSWVGHKTCNQYDGTNEPSEDKAVKARQILERYNFFHDRYRANRKAVEFAERTVVMATAKAYELQALKGTGEQGTAFLSKAVNTVIECRRVLAWTYCCAYYLAAPDKSSQRELFDLQQSQLEDFTDKLQELTEKELTELLDNQVKISINHMAIAMNKYRLNLISTVRGHRFDIDEQNKSSFPTTLKDKIVGNKKKK